MNGFRIGVPQRVCRARIARVVAHLKVGLTMQDIDGRLAEDERPGVFLTNALTGWEPRTTKSLTWTKFGLLRRALRGRSDPVPSKAGSLPPAIPI